ncbi:MAG: hypothetical protein ACKPHU_07610, partial [Planctomycetaceae bacterium]
WSGDRWALGVDGVSLVVLLLLGLGVLWVFWVFGLDGVDAVWVALVESAGVLSRARSHCRE